MLRTVPSVDSFIHKTLEKPSTAHLLSLPFPAVVPSQFPVLFLRGVYPRRSVFGSACTIRFVESFDGDMVSAISGDLFRKHVVGVYPTAFLCDSKNSPSGTLRSGTLRSGVSSIPMTPNRPSGTILTIFVSDDSHGHLKYYDWLLILPQEVKHIWNASQNRTKILHLLTRYISFVTIASVLRSELPFRSSPHLLAHIRFSSLITCAPQYESGRFG